MTSVLLNPEMLVIPEDELPSSDRKQVRAFRRVVGEKPKEARLREKGHEKAQEDIEEHEAFLENLHDTVIMPGRPIPGPPRWLH